MIKRIKKLFNKKLSKTGENRFTIKLFLSIIYIIVITILIVVAFLIFQYNEEDIYFSEATNVNRYSYVEVDLMSEAFASYDDDEKTIHFIIDKHDSGAWNTYVVAISKEDYSLYKDIIDYTYERVEVVPPTLKVYGYPVIIDDSLLQLTLDNIVNFVPKENEVILTTENYFNYITNSYLDTTIEFDSSFDILLFIIALLIFIVFFLFCYTLFGYNKIIEVIETEEKKIKKKVNKKLKVFKKGDK